MPHPVTQREVTQWLCIAACNFAVAVSSVIAMARVLIFDSTDTSSFSDSQRYANAVILAVAFGSLVTILLVAYSLVVAITVAKRLIPALGVLMIAAGVTSLTLIFFSSRSGFAILVALPPFPFVWGFIIASVIGGTLCLIAMIEAIGWKNLSLRRHDDVKPPGTLH
jgi:hypothetical protein